MTKLDLFREHRTEHVASNKRRLSPSAQPNTFQLKERSSGLRGFSECHRR
jgi:hypothetical protein